jgi:hypothetical protein
VKEFLEEFTDIVCALKVLLPVGADVEHHIKMTGPPIVACFRRLDAEKLAAANAEFLQLEKDGIVCRSDSPWSSPLHMVQKADGVVVALRRFPSPQPSHRRQLLPTAQHVGFCKQAGWVHYFFEIFSNTCT